MLNYLSFNNFFNLSLVLRVSKNNIFNLCLFIVFIKFFCCLRVNILILFFFFLIGIFIIV